MKSELTEMIKMIWSKLEGEARQTDCAEQRLYKRIDLEKETGIRLGVTKQGYVKELLIEIAKGDYADFVLPEWEGMKYQIIMLEVPRKETRHIRLYIDDESHFQVFADVCADIIAVMLKVCNMANRIAALKACLEKWNRFFKKYGSRGLSWEAQRGLFGEIFWLRKTIFCGMDKYKAIDAWQGYKKNCHDFETPQMAVEVKTTTSKEPRKVFINSEKQLDDRGIAELYLYVLTIHKSISSGKSLPSLIDDVILYVKDNFAAKDLLVTGLYNAGYLDSQRHLYNNKYIVRKEEIFHICEGFPRIIDLPHGTGDISYSLTLSACKTYDSDPASVAKIYAGGA